MLNQQHNDVLKKVSEDPLIKGIFARLRSELSPALRYHSVDHAKDVLSDVVLFALHDKLDERSIHLLSLSAAFHDAGFIERYDRNEIIGAAMATQAMREAGGYSEEEIREVEQSILSTELIDSPGGFIRVQHTPHSCYLLDADLGSFGREDFFEKCLFLIEERNEEPGSFYHQALMFLRDHEWLTPAARALRGSKKAENLAQLEKMLRERIDNSGDRTA